MKYLPVALPVCSARVRSQRSRRLSPAAENLYGNAAERRRHRRQIAVLCAQGRHPHRMIVRLYAEVLADMRPAARVTDYLPIFVSRRVQHLLRT